MYAWKFAYVGGKFEETFLAPNVKMRVWQQQQLLAKWLAGRRMRTGGWRAEFCGLAIGIKNFDTLYETLTQKTTQTVATTTWNVNENNAKSSWHIRFAALTNG